MPKPFTPQEKELIQKRLLASAKTLFAQYGLKKTSIEQIAKMVGISKGGFYLFYDSKEALFFEALEQVEQNFRQEILASIAVPGPSARIRLFTILKNALRRLHSLPLLQIFQSSDIELLMQRLPNNQFQEHLKNDREFIDQFIERCQENEIPIQAPNPQVYSLMYSLLFFYLQEQDFRSISNLGTTDLLIELAAAYLLGEVQLEAQEEKPA